jgi:hypothetical protein
MYSSQEASKFRKKFWTIFGQYMRPLRNADDEPVNWLNYKTGIKHLYFRMNAGKDNAAIAIELSHPDPLVRQHYFEKFRSVEKILNQTTGENWEWQLHRSDEDGKLVSRIGTQLKNVNIYDEKDWPAIISFLKPRMLALDRFWNIVKDGFDY